VAAVKLTVNSRVLLDSVKAVKHAASTEEFRPILASVVIETEGQAAWVVAADNYRIAASVLRDVNVEAGGQAVIRLPDVRLLLAYLTSHVRRSHGRSIGVPIDVEQIAGAVTFNVKGGPSLTLTCRDEPYTNWRAILPKLQEGERTVNIISAAFLSDIAAFGPVSVGLASSPENYTKAVEIRGDGYVEYIMPIRPEGDQLDRKPYPWEERS
jgi:DNA polymerase III sliding clamp (beta) subunit (PCNA family)